MAKVKEREAVDRDAGGYPRKYWWVVLIIVPVALAAIQFQPWKRSSSSDAAGRSVAAHEIGTAVLGDVSVVVNEAASAGATIDPELRAMIEEAVKLGRQGQHDAAIARIERVRQSSSNVAGLPSLLTGLGAEYAAAGRTDQARKSFEEVLAKDPGNQMALRGLAILPDAPVKGIRLVNFSSEVGGRWAANLVDGNPATIWTSWDGVLPQTFVIELPVEYRISEVSFNNSATGEADRAAKDVEISVSSQSATSGFEAAGKGTLAQREIGQGVPLSGSPVGRWVKVRVLSNYGSGEQTYLGDIVVSGRPRVR
jgi:hypothetical protein